jgi:hypothetical protein
MINEIYSVTLAVKIVDMNAGAGSVQLQSVYKGKEKEAEWSILLGPGQVDATTGLYKVDKSAADRFVVVQAYFEAAEMYGYIILPLPLTEAERALPGTVEMSPEGQLREVRALN